MPRLLYFFPLFDTIILSIINSVKIFLTIYKNNNSILKSIYVVILTIKLFFIKHGGHKFNTICYLLIKLRP